MLQPASLLKGCKCVKSACRKSYCICFKEGIKCKDICQCVGCENAITNRFADTSPNIATIGKPNVNTPVEPVEKPIKKRKILLEETEHKSKSESNYSCCFHETFITNEDIKNVSRRLFVTLEQGVQAKLSEKSLEVNLIKETVFCLESFIDKIKLEATNMEKPVTQNHLPSFDSFFNSNMSIRILNLDPSSFSKRGFKSLISGALRGETLNQGAKLLNSVHSPLLNNALPQSMISKINNQISKKQYVSHGKTCFNFRPNMGGTSMDCNAFSNSDKENDVSDESDDGNFRIASRASFSGTLKELLKMERF